jgi:NAD(P)-dependent dehydrogenase (short-subunit alcohol dehydrogenase family)
MELGLSGQVAIVTGGSFGVGRASAERFAAEGARVAIVARNQGDLDTAAEQIRATTGGEVLAVAADVGKMEQVAAMAERVVEQFGGIDIVVNNAGTGNANSFEQMTDELLGEDLQLKLYGAVHCIRAALPALKERGGVIINITTPAGKAAPGASVPTSLSRAAGIALTKALSKEYAVYGIRVNTVCVSHIKSRQNERRWQKRHAEDPSYSLDQFWEDGGKVVALGRVAEAHEAGDVVVFLASERASFVTGTAINVDGGAAPTV